MKKTALVVYFAELAVMLLTIYAALKFVVFTIQQLDASMVYPIGFPIFVLVLVSLVEFGRFLDEVVDTFFERRR